MEASERFAEIWQRLSRNQRKFVVLSGEYATKAETAEALGLHRSTVYHWDGIVDEAIGLLQIDLLAGAREELRTAVARAAMVKIEGLDEADARLRQHAASEILDRVLGKANARNEAAGDGISEVRVSYVEENDLRSQD